MIQVPILKQKNSAINPILDSSDSAPPPSAPIQQQSTTTEKSDSESVFLKSLSALRDNNLSPANENSVLTAGRLVGAMGINSSDGSDDGELNLNSLILNQNSILDKEKFEFLKFQ